MKGKTSVFVRQWTFFHELHEALEREVTNTPQDFDLSSLIEKTRELESRLVRTPGGVERAKDCRKAAGLPVSHEFEISFCASGHITQTVEITDLKLTAEQLQRGLNSGKYVTTVQEDGTVDITKSGKKIGVVRNVDNELSYEDFTVEDQSL